MHKVMIGGALLIALVCGSPVAFGSNHDVHATKLVSTKKTSKHVKKHAAKKQHKHSHKSHAK